MRAACPKCAGELVQRVYLSVVDGARPMFAESYNCGAVHIWGQIASGTSVPRECEAVPDRSQLGLFPTPMAPNREG